MQNPKIKRRAGKLWNDSNNSDERGHMGELTDLLNQLLKETVFSYYDSWMEHGITPKFDIAEEPVQCTGSSQDDAEYY